MTTAAPPPTDAGISSRDGASTYATYVPHDLKYSADFEDSLIQAVLHADQPLQTIKPDTSDDQPPSAAIAESDLPLLLTDPRRTFPSPIPGVRLTHAGGYIEGGPGLDPEMDTFPDDFLSSRPDIRGVQELQRAVETEVQVHLGALRERLEGRRKARENNERVERELRVLRDQHSMEMMIHSKMRDEVVKKKEARERRRREKGAAPGSNAAGASAGGERKVREGEGGGG